MRRSILKQITYFVLSVNINHLDIIEKHFQKKLNNWGGGGLGLMSGNYDGYFLSQMCIRIDDDRQSCKFHEVVFENRRRINVI